MSHPSPIRVVLCDDHPLFRRGVGMMLNENSDMRVVFEASDDRELHAAIREHALDVLVLDLNLPGRSGLDVLASLRAEGFKVPVLIMSMYPEKLYLVRSFRAGAQGYVNKAADPAALVEAIRTVARGRKYIPPESAQLLADMLMDDDPESAHNGLSEREMETLLRLVRGSKLSEIARDLMLSPKTVSVYRARVMEKLQLRTTAELTAYAIRNQLI